MSDVDPRAICFGVVVDQALTLAAALLLGSLEGLLAAGIASTALGGFVAASIAPASPIRHGLAVGAAALAIGVLSTAGGAGSELPRWYTAAAFAAALPAGALGGGAWAVARRQKTI